MKSSGADETDRKYALAVRRTLWPNLPLLLVGGAAIDIAVIGIQVFAPGVNPASLILSAIIAGPLFAGLVSQWNRILNWDDEPRTFSIFSHSRKVWLLALWLLVPPAVTGSCFLVGLVAYRQTSVLFLLFPIAVSGIATVLLCLAAMTGVCLGVALPQLRGWRLIVSGLHIVARKPRPIATVLLFGAFFVWGANQFTASIILLLPGPLAVSLVAATWTSARAAGLVPSDPSSSRRTASVR